MAPEQPEQVMVTLNSYVCSPAVSGAAGSAGPGAVAVDILDGEFEIFANG